MPRKQSLKQLTDLWYKKLEKSGFKDAESRTGKLNTWESSHAITEAGDAYKQLKPFTNYLQYQTMLSQREEYFRLAGFFLYDNKWKNKRDRRLWELHCEGMPIRKMAKRFRTTFWGIQHKLAEFAEEMKSMYGVTSVGSDSAKDDE